MMVGQKEVTKTPVVLFLYKWNLRAAFCTAHPARRFHLYKTSTGVFCDFCLSYCVFRDLKLYM
jgi:hypothetical protein